MQSFDDLLLFAFIVFFVVRWYLAQPVRPQWDDDTWSLMDTIDTLRNEVEDQEWDDALFTVACLRNVIGEMKIDALRYGAAE